MGHFIVVASTIIFALIGLAWTIIFILFKLFGEGRRYVSNDLSEFVEESISNPDDLRGIIITINRNNMYGMGKLWVIRYVTFKEPEQWINYGGYLDNEDSTGDNRIHLKSKIRRKIRKYIDGVEQDLRKLFQYYNIKDYEELNALQYVTLKDCGGLCRYGFEIDADYFDNRDSHLRSNVGDLVLSRWGDKAKQIPFKPSGPDLC